MTFVQDSSAPREETKPGRERYLVHTSNLMMVVIDFNDGPAAQPDAPHHHVHEQISYCAAGEILFFVDGVPHHMRPGDMIAVASNVPHCVQPLTSHVRLIDTFNPIREDFLHK